MLNINCQTRACFRAKFFKCSRKFPAQRHSLAEILFWDEEMGRWKGGKKKKKGAKGIRCP